MPIDAIATILYHSQSFPKTENHLIGLSLSFNAIRRQQIGRAKEIFATSYDCLVSTGCDSECFQHDHLWKLIQCFLIESINLLHQPHSQNDKWWIQKQRKTIAKQNRCSIKTSCPWNNNNHENWKKRAIRFFCCFLPLSRTNAYWTLVEMYCTSFNSELESAAIQLLYKDFPFIATEIFCNWERFVQQKGNQYVINLLLQIEIYPPWYLMYADDLLKARTPNELYPS